MALPSGFIKPCLPSKVPRPTSGSLWVHEIKHDGYRLMVRRDGPRVRCFPAGSLNDGREAVGPVHGEAVIVRDDGTPDFHALRSRDSEAVLYASI